jgi:MarR family 2-MHQ and catechol resistance regulon transcriptional repressor
MKDKLYREVYWLLRVTSIHLKVRLQKMIEDYDITWQQFHAMYHIGDEGIPATELAKELNCNTSNMTGLIDRMSENNWVYRERSKSDRRIWLIKLTKAGIALKAKLMPQHHQNLYRIMSVLSEEELICLKALLMKLDNREDV